MTAGPVEPSLWAAKDRLAARFVLGRPATAFRAYALSMCAPDPAVNVVGVGIGTDQPDGRDCISVLVRRKFTAGEIGADHLLPSRMDGHRVRVDEVGILERQTAPGALHAGVVAPGLSIGVSGRTWTTGTVTALVRDGSTPLLLSCNHVLSDEGTLPLGTAIVQPGAADGGTSPDDDVGRLVRSVPLCPSEPNAVDAAVCSLAASRRAVAVVAGLKALGDGGPQALSGSVGVAALGDPVLAAGRTSGRMAGVVTTVGATVSVLYAAGSFVFTGQTLVAGTDGAFSAAGDSGAPVLAASTGAVVGMVIGGSPVRSVVTDFGTVLAALGVSFP